MAATRSPETDPGPPPAGYRPKAGYTLDPKTGFWTNSVGGIDTGDPNVAKALAASKTANPNASSGGYGVGADGNPLPGQAPIAPAAADPYDYSQDPILQKIKAAGVRSRTDAAAAALAARKSEAIQFGDAADQSDLDGTTAGEAAGNPFSILANLARGYTTTAHDHGEQLNQANLWYSGAHAKTLADDALGYQQQQYDARLAHQGREAGIAQALAQGYSAADASEIAGEQDAAARAQQRAANNGTDPGAPPPTNNNNDSSSSSSSSSSGSGGNGSFGTTASSTEGVPRTPAALATKVASIITSSPVTQALKKPTAQKNAYLTSSTKRG